MKELQVGFEVPPLLKNVNRLQLVKYAGASGDFNPLHFDDHYAKEKGQDSIIMHGMLGMGFIGELLGNFFENKGFVKEIKVRFIKVVPVDSKVIAKAKVIEVQQEENQKIDEITFDVWVENEEGHTTLKGNATVQILE